MIRKIRNISNFLLAILLLTMVASISNAKAPEPVNVILISWDGVQRNHLNELLDAGKLPNIKALGKEGVMIPVEVTTHVTDTKSGHTQMLTGYNPETTGVYSNGKYDAIPEGLSILERLEKQFGDENITTVFLTGKSHHIGSCPAGKRPEGKRLNKKNMKRAMKDCPAEPWNLVKNNIDVWDGDKARKADEVGNLALDYLDKYGSGRFFFFVHFADPDAMGHKYGENSDEYSNAIITCDEWLGKIRAKLDELGISGKTLIYATSDHGFDEGKFGHADAPYIYLATNDPMITAKEGDQMDLVPTILKRMGIDIGKVEPSFPGKPLF